MANIARIILYVDDDEDDRELLSQTITSIDPTLQVIEAQNGNRAIEFLAKAKKIQVVPCLIILDLNMPGMDGKRTLAEIRKDEELKNLPIVIFTTSSNEADQAFCNAYGVAMFSKPSNLNGMELEVKHMLAYCAEA